MKSKYLLGLILLSGIIGCASQPLLTFENASAGNWRIVPMRWDAKAGSVCEATIISREQIDYFWSNANEISATDWQQRPLIRPCQVSGLVHINDTSYDFFVTADGYGVLWLGNEEQHFFHCANCVEHWESMG